MTKPNPLKKLCTATKKDGSPCNQYAMRGQDTCLSHRPKPTVKGIAHHRFKTGKYSSVLPVRLLSQYHQSMADPEYLSLKNEIALLDARIEDLLKRVDTGESGKLWKNLKAVADNLYQVVREQRREDLDNVTRKGYEQLQQELTVELFDIIHSAKSDSDAWQDVMAVIERRRRLVATETARVDKATEYIRSEEAQTLIAALLNSIRANVTDRHILAAIQADFIRLVSASGKAKTESSAE